MVDASHLFDKDGDWVPYVGPDGGEGWRNTETDEVLYQEEPPGRLNTSELTEEQVDELADYLVEQGILGAEEVDEVVGEETADYPGDIESAEDMPDGAELVSDVDELEIGDEIFVEYEGWNSTETSRGEVEEIEDGEVKLDMGSMFVDTFSEDSLAADMIFYGNDRSNFLEAIGEADRDTDDEIFETFDVEEWEDNKGHDAVRSRLSESTEEQFSDSIDKILSEENAEAVREIAEGKEELQEAVLALEVGPRVVFDAAEPEHVVPPEGADKQWFDETFEEGEEMTVYYDKATRGVSRVRGDLDEVVSDEEREYGDGPALAIDKGYGSPKMIGLDRVYSVDSEKYRGPPIEDFDPEPLDTDVLETGLSIDEIEENLDRAVEQVANHVGEEYAENAREVMEKWDNHGYGHYATAPLWKAVQEQFGGNVPRNIERRDVEEGTLEACKGLVKIAQTTIQDQIDEEELTLHRGFSENILHDYAEIDKEEGTVTIQPQALESWSWNSSNTIGHGEFAAEMDIDVDDIVMSSAMFMKWNHRSMQELTVNRDEPYVLDKDQIEAHSLPEDMMPEPLFDEEEEKMHKELRPLPVEESNWTHTSLVEDEEEEEDVEKEWVPHVGPAGEGWKNTETGEIVYQENPPGQVNIDEVPEKSEVDKGWVPYVGPQGGQGWRNTDTEEIIYQEEPPGPIDEEELEVVADVLREYQDEYEEAGFDVDAILDRIEPDGEAGSFEELNLGDKVRVEAEFQGAVDEVEGRYGGTKEIAGDEYHVVEWDNGSAPINEEMLVGEIEVLDEAGDALEETIPDDPWEYAVRAQGARAAGITGGNTTGDEMEILDMPDGRRIFATPTEAYDHITTGVVESQQEARENNINSPKALEALGAGACETKLVEGPNGEEYIAKEGVEGETWNNVRDKKKKLSENDELRENLIDMVASAYVIGNADLHGGNFMKTADDDFVIIDHDSAGENRMRGQWPNLAMVTPYTLNDWNDEVWDAAFDKIMDILKGENDVRSEVEPEYADRTINECLEFFVEYSELWEDEPGSAAYLVDGYEDTEDFEVGESVRLVDTPVDIGKDNMTIAEGTVIEVMEDSIHVAGNEGQEFVIAQSDLNRVLEVFE